MKNTKCKQKFIKDVMVEAKKHKLFKRYSEAAAVKIRLAVEIFEAREAKKLSQQELAKISGTTQKVISKIENGDVNIGIDLLNRIIESLNFTSKNLVKIFNCGLVPSIKLSLKTESPTNEFSLLQGASDLINSKLISSGTSLFHLS